MSNVKFRDIFNFIIQFEYLQRCKTCNSCTGVLIRKFFFALCLFQAGCIGQTGLSEGITRETSSKTKAIA